MAGNGERGMVKVAGTPMGAEVLCRGVVVAAMCSTCERRVWIDRADEVRAGVVGVECLWCFAEADVSADDAEGLALISRIESDDVSPIPGIPATKASCRSCGRRVWVSDSLIGHIDLSALECPDCAG